jgi:hypothetical protein
MRLRINSLLLFIQLIGMLTKGRKIYEVLETS